VSQAQNQIATWLPARVRVRDVEQGRHLAFLLFQAQHRPIYSAVHRKALYAVSSCHQEYPAVLQVDEGLRQREQEE